MRKGIIYLTITAFLLGLGSCKDFLALEPLDKVSAEDLLASQAGVKTLMATLYNRMPMEDFAFNPASGFNQHPGVGSGGAGDGGWSLASNTDEAIIYGPNNYNSSPATDITGNWDYTGIRYINRFLEIIDELKAGNKLSEADYKQLYGEALFLRAFTYFSMVKRYGGVPIIDEVQPLPDDVADVMVPRSTEKETWDFVISDLDLAIANLPDLRPSNGLYRVTKWVALALKSRVTLHAASVAKFWDKAPLTGAAVDAKLVGGMTSADANAYYLLCINASKEIMDNPAFSLYMPNPANKAEAAKNYQTMFEYASYANPELIYIKSYIDGAAASGQGHVTDFWFYPKQLCYHTLYMSSRWGTTLDAVDVYEDYTDDGTGASAPIKTRVDGNEGYIIPNPRNLGAAFNAADYLHYDNQYAPFANKDARLTASVLLPGSTFKGTLINMQGGMVRQNGTLLVYTDGSAPGLDGNTYYTFGSNNISGYSAFGALGTAQDNYSSTGFALRKYLQDTKSPTSLALYGSTQPWVEMRLAEIYLNYAEAVAESGQGDATLAAKCLNDIRKRAAHTDNIPLTVANVLKERRVEMIFENSRYWDLIRRRDFHDRFDATRRFSLVPMIDLTVNPPKYIFMRVHNYYDDRANGLTFVERRYYMSIPGVSGNMLIQNPEY
ncbi:MAG: RagB/SusD family nutrient uptake outer membrane protein [Bacteroidales bacterium]|nr:RagB/SusD family nutrient uptake outer membrane protein [Bacteroidales bacterium]